VEGSYDHGNEPSASMKRWIFLEWLSDLGLLRRTQLPGMSYLVVVL
jgi:hypothetical protein